MVSMAKKAFVVFDASTGRGCGSEAHKLAAKGRIRVQTRIFMSADTSQNPKVSEALKRATWSRFMAGKQYKVFLIGHFCGPQQDTLCGGLDDDAALGADPGGFEHGCGERYQPLA